MDFSRRVEFDFFLIRGLFFTLVGRDGREKARASAVFVQLDFPLRMPGLLLMWHAVILIYLMLFPVSEPELRNVSRRYREKVYEEARRIDTSSRAFRKAWSMLMTFTRNGHFYELAPKQLGVVSEGCERADTWTAFHRV